MGVDFEKSHIDYFKAGQKDPAYMKINPNAALPALVDNDMKLWESNAILPYVADKHEVVAYHPRDLKVRADFNC